MSRPAIRLLLADDHPIVLEGLEQLFRLEPDVEVVARCRDGEETLRAVERLRPDVLVLDVRMPGVDGLEVLRRLAAEPAAPQVVLLTATLDEQQLLGAIRLGARGIVLKEMAPQLLVEAVREVHGGGQWLDKGTMRRALATLLQREAGAHQAAHLLTARELEIVRMVVGGQRNRQIAEGLGISEGTVKIHLHNVYEKLGVGGRLELVLWAQDRGLA